MADCNEAIVEWYSLRCVMYHWWTSIVVLTLQLVPVSFLGLGFSPVFRVLLHSSQKVCSTLDADWQGSAYILL
jgi:hypothetical protein